MTAPGEQRAAREKHHGDHGHHGNNNGAKLELVKVGRRRGSFTEHYFEGSVAERTVSTKIPS